MNKDKKQKKDKKQRKGLKGQFSDLKNCGYMLAQAAKHSPAFLICTIIEGIVNGVVYGLLGTVMLKVLYDKLEQGASFTVAALVVVVMILLRTFASGYGYFYGWSAKQWMRQRLHREMHRRLFRKARELDLSCYDDPAFYNDFVWALNESDGRTMSIVEDVRALIQTLIQSVTTLGVLLTIDPLTVVFGIAAGLFEAWYSNAFNKMNKEYRERVRPYERESEYVARAMTLPEYAKELRNGHAAQLLRRQYDRTLEARKDELRRYHNKCLPLEMACDFVSTYVKQLGLYAYLIYRLFTGGITLGGFAAAENSIWSLFYGFSNIAKTYAKFVEHGMYSEKYRTFLEYQPKITDGEGDAPTIDALAFDGVTFRYPGTEHDSLKNVSFTVKRGERVAIVGYNGAGKTTLIKLLLRLYDPSEGTVRLNGGDIKELKVEGYREKFATIFQDFRLFASTIGENVAAAPYADSDRARVEEALNRSNFDGKLGTLKNGIDTVLTREFDDEGVNLSGGEEQKLAIARVFAHGGEVIVMDEPSSALDPMSEAALNQTLLDGAQDKTVFIISHRLSTTRMADRILMFADGELIEDGSHDELMRADGKYAEMFRMQAEKYTRHGHT